LLKRIGLSLLLGSGSAQSLLFGCLHGCASTFKGIFFSFLTGCRIIGSAPAGHQSQQTTGNEIFHGIDSALQANIKKKTTSSAGNCFCLIFATANQKIYHNEKDHLSACRTDDPECISPDALL
jgi:hypothetical protein